VSKYPEYDPGVWAVAPRSIEEAQREVARCDHEMMWMKATYEGCDWCEGCGGGEVTWKGVAHRKDLLIEWLAERGVPPEQTPERCVECGYFEGTIKHPNPEYACLLYCERCAHRNSVNYPHSWRE
jgi:hypothetical protein